MKPDEQAATRVCPRCSESVSGEAFKCPHCGLWREDINRDRIRYAAYTLSAAACALIALVLFIFIWIHSEHGLLGVDGLAGEWHHRATPLQSFSDVVARTEAYLRDNPAPQQRSITYFSLGRFLCSVWTWLILVLAAAALFSLRRALRARDRLKQILHTASFLILFT